MRSIVVYVAKILQTREGPMWVMRRLALFWARGYADTNPIIVGGGHGADGRLPVWCGSFSHNG
jgi:hypothetical protein